jgi:hypothetical protein
MRNKNQFRRITVAKSLGQLEMIRLQQTLAGEAFIYSIIFN